VVAWVMSAGVFAIGSLPLTLAASDDYPWGFATGLTACFWTLAVWNVSTLPRDSEIPTGRWLVALSTLCLVTGLAGAWSSYVGYGALLAVLGCAGFVVFWKESRPPERSTETDEVVPSTARHERDESGPPVDSLETARGSGHRGRPHPLGLWVSGTWLLGLVAMIGFMLLSIAGDYEKGPAHPRLAIALAVLWLASFATAYVLQGRWERTPPSQ
jgi:hypothetical protein